MKRREQAGGDLVAGLDTLVGDHSCSKAQGLLEEVLHHVRSGDTLGEAGIVLHVGGEHELSAGDQILAECSAWEDQRVEVRSGGIYGGGPFQPGLLQLVVVGRNPSAPPGFLGLDIDMNLLVSASVFFVTGVFAVLWFNQVRNFSTEHAPASPEEIMDAIIDLDVRFEAGDLAEDVYQPRRRALKSRLSERIENSD